MLGELVGRVQALAEMQRLDAEGQIGDQQRAAELEDGDALHLSLPCQRPLRPACCG